MREIKYKAFIKKLNAIYEVWTMVFLEEWIRVFLKREIQEWEQTNYLIDWVDNVLIQFTWLVDKAWVWIYEGDIIEYENIKIIVGWIEKECRFNIIKYWIHKYKIIWNKYIENV